VSENERCKRAAKEEGRGRREGDGGAGRLKQKVGKGGQRVEEGGLRVEERRSGRALCRGVGVGAVSRVSREKGGRDGSDKGGKCEGIGS